MPVFYVVCNHFRFEIIFVSFSFSITIKFSALSFRLYFVSVLLNISVSVFVSVNEIISFSVSVSISVNEYITVNNVRCLVGVADMAKSMGVNSAIMRRLRVRENLSRRRCHVR